MTDVHCFLCIQLGHRTPSSQVVKNYRVCDDHAPLMADGLLAAVKAVRRQAREQAV